MENLRLVNCSSGYLFNEIAEKVNRYQSKARNKLFNLGIGDVTLPLPSYVTKAMENASKELSEASSFKGYSPSGGYSFLKNAVKRKYLEYKVELSENEIFITDGAKGELFKILTLFSKGITVLLTDPCYPAYSDVNSICGNYIRYASVSPENGFLLDKIEFPCDLIYLCSPSNPSGEAYNKETLKKIVDYAEQSGAVIIYDACYSSFIKSDKPRSIYEIKGAEKVAIEINSFSKNYGFTGIRCGYTIVPNALKNYNALYNRLNQTVNNGVSYITQRGAEAAISPENRIEADKIINYYLSNAETIRNTLNKLNVKFTGGIDAPYVFFKCPKKLSSKEMFEILLIERGIISTPGAGFGKNGEGFMRLSCFANSNDIKEGVKLLEAELKSLNK